MKTSTPYRLGDAGHTIFGPKNGNPSPVTVATCLNDENAHFLVTAANAYESMQDLICRLIPYMEEIKDDPINKKGVVAALIREMHSWI